MNSQKNKIIPTYISYYGTAIETLSTDELFCLKKNSLQKGLPREFLILIEKVINRRVKE